MNKEIHVAFITQKLKEQFESLKEEKFEDKELYKFIIECSHCEKSVIVISPSEFKEIKK